MQQIFNFITRNSYRILFLLLLGISLTLTIQFHSFHRSKVISSANVVSGSIYKEINETKEYLNLRKENEDLALENAMLRSLLFQVKDSAFMSKLDTIKGVKPSDIVVAKVIKNSYSVYENYLTLDAGAKQGIKPDMAVINSLGIVGITDDTSENYSTVISILNKKSRINAKIKKSNHFGSLIWDGKSTGFVQLVDVPRLATIHKGDTVVTGGQSVIFPENINIGTIHRVFRDKDNQTNFYTLEVKLFNDMTNLGHVYILKSKGKEEITKLENQRKKDE
ncbi:rod shape-determining protein MreC [Flavobacterium succinicans]|uniref:Cell shape-determining protein MreC n=1 Tax=Flavobacterium succinicans TaxID=29536 RepID=A0A199XRV7_9FLAO|nr:rod shape-determining protein MreC [Flavobacterium succinicans]OAZ04064.1 cell shape-determining protein MreC precursor [Flavobacterium succinicans]